jgi:hypothetical protein
LAGAEALLMSTDQQLTRAIDKQLMRAVVLEAITALEAFVRSRVFDLLKGQLDPLLVRWLEQKTRNDFESRLSVFTPVALGRPVDRGSKLWNDYQTAKQIRNKVTHTGRRVSRDEARFVVRTVYDWLAFLGSTVEVELALQGLEMFVETSGVHIDHEVDASNVVRDYFKRTKAASLQGQPTLKGPQVMRPDLMLEFGNYKVLVEVKFSDRLNLLELINRSVQQTLSYLRHSEVARGAVIIFHTGKVPEPYRQVQTLEDGKVSLVVIQT